jgi:LacI family transcriptional regulator
MAGLQKDVAEALGVSQMTVSRALRGESGMSEETRRRILIAARKAGIVTPALRSQFDNRNLQHTFCVSGCPTTELQQGNWLFTIRLQNGLARGGKECASQVLICPETFGDGVWPAPVLRREVDGLVVLEGNDQMPRHQTPCPVPHVYVFSGPAEADIVTVNNFGGGMQLGEHLAAAGHRRVAFIGPDTLMARERLAGLRMGLEPAGGECPPDVVKLRRDCGGHEPVFVEELLAGQTRAEALRRRFTAIACYNDWFAVHAMRGLRERGLRVPEDFGLTGFDNVLPPGYDGPKLTTCSVPIEDLFAEAARFLYWRIEHPNTPRRTLMLDVAWVKGESA